MIRKPKRKKRAKSKKGFNLGGYVFGALRKIWRWHPVRRQCLALSEIGGKPSMYMCALCGNIFPKTEVQIDHKVPVVDPATGFVDWNTYIHRLFDVTTKDVQTLCKECHKSKTTRENRQRS